MAWGWTTTTSTLSACVGYEWQVRGTERENTVNGWVFFEVGYRPGWHRTFQLLT